MWYYSSKKLLRELKKKYRIFESKKESIDGILVDTEKGFSLSIEWVQEKYKFLNRKYFKNLLPPLSTEQIKITFDSYYRGQVTASFIKSTKETFDYKVISLEISAYRNLSEKEFYEALLHEMLHIYLGVIGKLSLEQDHNNLFAQEIQKLNTLGWDIPLSSTHYNPPSEKGLQRLRDSCLVIYVNTVGRYYAFLVSKELTQEVKKILKTVFIINLHDPLKYQDLPYIEEDFSSNLEKGIPMKEVKKEDLQEFLKKTEVIFYEAGKRRKTGIPEEILKWGESLSNTEILSIEKEMRDGEEHYRFKIVSR